MALGNILITAVPMPSGVVSSKYRNGNNPNGTPSLSGAQNKLSFVAGTGGTYNFGAYGTDPDNDSPLTYTLTPNNITGISLSSSGLLTVGTNAVAAIRNMTVTISDPGLLSSDFPFTLTITSVAAAADFTIPAATYDRTIDGFSANAYTTNTGTKVTWASLSPSGKTLPKAGDTIVLAATAGNAYHGRLVFLNIRGNSLSDPIYIKGPQTGTDAAVIRSQGISTGGFVLNFVDCRFFKVDGYLAGRTSNRSCGIKVMYSNAATTNNKDGPSCFVKLSASSATYKDGITDNCVLKHIEIDGGWNIVAGNSFLSNGIGISTNYEGIKRTAFPDKWQENITIEYCWIKNTEGEGMYIGPNWYIESLPCRNATIRYNRMENTNWCGFQLKSWVGGVNQIYGNEVISAGFGASTGHWAGIQLLEGTYQVYANYIETTYKPGIIFWNGNTKHAGLSGCPRSYGPLDAIAYNNVIVDSGDDGITVGGTPSYGGVDFATWKAQIYNNTIIRSGALFSATGITASSDSFAGSFIRNNLIAGATGSVLSPASTTANVTVTGNRSGTVAAQNFVSDVNKNYRLTATSPARDAGITGYPATDFDGTVRPSGASADQGAFEYVA